MSATIESAQESQPAQLASVRSDYRVDIDGMRGVAVALVCLFHAGCWPFSGGYIGVDVFFVISGFVITQVLLRDLDGQRLSLRRFFLRRIRRLAPALLVMLASSVVLFSLIYPPVYLRSFGQSLWAQALFSSNIYFWRTTDYFGTPYEAKPLLHTWSLAVEEQFYLFFSFALLLLARVARSTLFITLAGCLLLSLSLSALATIPHPNASFYLLPTRAWELLTGALLAIYLSGRGALLRPGPMIANICATAGLAAVVAAAVLYDQTTPFPYVYAALPVAGTAAMIWADAYDSTFVGSGLSLRPVVFLGKISYSLYLWHWITLAFVRWTSFGTPAAAARLAAILAALVLAYFSWRWLETPVRARTVLRSDTRLVAIVVIATVLTGAYGYLADSSGGFPWRARAALAAMQTPTLSPRMSECFDDESPTSVRFCEIGNRAAERVTFVAIGDSHALALLPALDSVASAHGLKGWFAATSGCLPFVGSVPVRDAKSKERCRFLIEDTLRRVRERGIANVVLVARWDYYTQVSPDGTFQPVISQAHPATTLTGSRAVFAEQYRATVDAYTAIGASLYVVLQVPHQRMDPQSYVFRQTLPAFLGGIEDQSSGTLALPEHRAAQQYTDSVLESPSQVHVFDPSHLLCPHAGPCLLFREGKTLYYDNNHLSVTGAQFVSPALAPLFEKIAADTGASAGPSVW